MKKTCLLLVMILIFSFITGCSEIEDVEKNNNIAKDSVATDMDKFFPNSNVYTAELFVEMANTYDGILEGSSQQVYVFDLRSKEKYDEGHILGAINIELKYDEMEDLIDKIPSDWSVYVIADNDEVAENFVLKLKEKDELLFVYYIKGGYGALEEIDGIEKYITVRRGKFIEFSRKEVNENFRKNHIVSA